MSESDQFNENPYANNNTQYNERHQQLNECMASEDGPIPKKRSLVWQFFERVNQFRVRCYLCQHEQNYQGTTGNILRHLKSKHDLDLTLKAQQEPENQRRIKELCEVADNISGALIKIERKTLSTPSFPKPVVKRKQSYDEDFDVNPYEEEDEDNEVYPLETYIASEDPFHLNENSVSSNEDAKRPANGVRKDKSQLDDERIKAETKYFIEKANYYKLQKHLTALQAKKVKIEIEQLSATNSHNKYEGV